MILGFAHLTRSTASPDAVIADFARGGMSVKARRRDVPSASGRNGRCSGIRPAPTSWP